MLKLAIIACTLLPAGVGQVEVDADYVLRGATIYDGTGSDGEVGDVAIKNDRIVAVGKFAAKGNPRILDVHRPGARARLHRPAHAQR